jgi:hypothetical protein
MAKIIQGGAAMFDALMYGRPTQEMTSFLNRQFENVSQTLTEAGARFYQQAQAAFESASNDYAARMVRAAGRAISNFWMQDRIQTLTEIGQLQHAPPVMQRWIMAEPTVRKLYQDQRIEGYSESYHDAHPGLIGEAHPDYRAVRNGVIFLDEEPDDEGHVGHTSTTYLNGLLPDDDGLQFAEQLDIMATWAAVRNHIARGDEDPTSRFNANIG